MSKLVRLNSKTSTIKRNWQGAPVSFGNYKKNCSKFTVDVNKGQLCDPEPFSLPFSQKRKEVWEFIHLASHTASTICLSQRLGDPDLCPNHIYFQVDSSQENLIPLMCWNSSKDIRQLCYIFGTIV